MKLKPCPFCGGEARRTTITCGGFGTNEEGVIRCVTCGTQSGKKSTSWEAIEESWNLRLTTGGSAK